MVNYDCLKDEELVELSRQGDSKAIDALTLRYIPTARLYASRYNISNMENSDLVQEGLIGFLSAVYSYKTDSCASFSTFTHCCIRNRITSVVRSTLSQKRIPESAIVPLEEQSDSTDCQPSPEELLISDKGADYIADIIKQSLSKQEQDVFHLYLKGFSYDEIAHRTSISLKAVDSTMQRARKKLREKLSFYK